MRRFFSLGFGFLLSACGFQPVFRESSSSESFFSQMIQVSGDESKHWDPGVMHRFRILLSQQLQALFIPLPYPVEVRLAPTKKVVGFQEDASVSRLRRALDATIRIRAPLHLLERTVNVVTSFNQTPYAGLVNWQADQASFDRMIQSLVWEVIRNLQEMMRELSESQKKNQLGKNDLK
jgi:hypothetical protein